MLWVATTLFKKLFFGTLRAAEVEVRDRNDIHCTCRGDKYRAVKFQRQWSQEKCQYCGASIPSIRGRQSALFMYMSSFWGGLIGSPSLAPGREVVVHGVGDIHSAGWIS